MGQCVKNGSQTNGIWPFAAETAKLSLPSLQMAELTVAILRDLSEGQSKIMAVYTWRCPVCDHIDQYDSEDIERYQHPDL